MAIAEDPRAGGAPGTRARAAIPGLGLPPARLLRWEIFAVFAVSLGASGLNALLDLIGSLLSTESLGHQQAL
ncbi:MAG: CPBP family intramembrane glutamate endopeptidase, partial [Streptosporangiaceae bacterium]